MILITLTLTLTLTLLAAYIYIHVSQESESARLTEQLQSLEARQRQLVAAMLQLGGEPAVHQLKQVVASHLEVRKTARELEKVNNATKTGTSPSFQQAQLAHQILHNPEFQIKQEPSPFEEAISRVAKQAFWDAVLEKIGGGDYAPFVELLRTLNGKLVHILPNERFKEDVDKQVDVSFIQDVLKHSKIDQRLMQNLIESYVASIKQLDSPENDIATDNWLKQSLAQIDSQKDESDLILLIPDQFQWLLDRLENIEEAILNFRVQQIKPFLAEHGTDYVRAKFNESLADGGKQDLASSKAWIDAVMKKEQGKGELDFKKLKSGDSISTMTFIIRAIVDHISENGVQDESCEMIIPELLSLEKDLLVNYNKRWTIIVLSIFMTMRLKQVLQTEGAPLKTLEEVKQMKEAIVHIISLSRDKSDKESIQPVLEDVTEAIERSSIAKGETAGNGNGIDVSSERKQRVVEIKQEEDKDGNVKEKETNTGQFKGPRLTKIVIPKVLSEPEVAQLCADQFVKFVEDFKLQRSCASAEISIAGLNAIQSLIDPKDKVLSIVKDRVKSTISLQVANEALRTNSHDPGSSECRQKLAVIGATLFEDEVVCLAKDIALLAKRNSQLHASHYNHLVLDALKSSEAELAPNEQI